MDKETIFSLPSLKERKRLLGFMEDTSVAFDYHRKRPSEDPFPLRGGSQTIIKPKKFSTLPRKPKRSRMADKPPLAPKPSSNGAPIPKPRRKGPPPKPVPYRKHKEHKDQDVLTFKSNSSLQPSTAKPLPPQVPEKPPRRNSARGEPSSEFCRPKKAEPVPIQYSVPTIPSRLGNKGATIDSRPRLGTPAVPPEPPQALANGGSDSKETNELEVNSEVSNDGGLYTQAYGHVENGSEDVEGYATVPTSKAAAKPPTGKRPPPISAPPRTLPPGAPTPRTPPPLSPKPPPSLSQAEQDQREPKDSPGEYAVVPPTRKVEPTRTSSSSSISPSPNEYNTTVHSTSSTPVSSHPPADGYSKLNRPSSASKSPSLSPSHQLPLHYSAIDTPLVSPPPAGNPTQQAGYSHLGTPTPVAKNEGAIQDGEYEIVCTEPLVKVPGELVPKAKAKNASHKVKSGFVQLQSARDRSEFTTYAEDFVPMENKPRPERPPPPAKPVRPPLTYERTKAAHIPQKPVSQEPIIERTTTPLSNEDLERAGYETVNTLSPEPNEGTVALDPPDESGESLSQGRQFVVSPKVEVDIDQIIQMSETVNEEDGENDLCTQEDSFENPASVDAAHQECAELPEDPEAGLVLRSPDMFTVPQHAIPGPLGYCEMDVLPLEQQSERPPEDEEIVGAGVVEGDSITVKHHSFPNAEGYCDISSNTTPPKPPPAGVAIPNDDTLYFNVDERGAASPKRNPGGVVTPEASPTRNPGGMVASGASPQEPDAQGYCDIDLKSPPPHTYEIVSSSPPLASVNAKHAGPPPPNVKPKPRKTSSESVDAENPSTEDVPKTVSVSSPHRTRKSRPRRAPPPPPSAAKAKDDNVLPKKDNSSRVAGDIATLPRGQSLLKSPKMSPADKNINLSLNEQQPVKPKTVAGKPIPSPKLESSASPKGIKRFFAAKKSSSNSPETTKKSWKKMSLRGNSRDNPVVPVTDKTKSLPATARAKKSQHVPPPTLDTYQDENDMYATIAETMAKSSLASAHPVMETRRTSGGSKEFEALSKRRSSFRRKKEKIEKPIRKSNSAEHLYDTADSSSQSKASNRARLPIPDEVHAGLYAMVTSRPNDTEQKVETSPPPLATPPSESAQNPEKNSASPCRNSLYEREGLVVTSLDDKFGNEDSEETFVSSADIVHTVSSEGSVYAVIKNKPKAKKRKSSSVSAEEAGGGQAVEPQAENLSEIPRKPPRSPLITSRPPPPYQKKKNSLTDAPSISSLSPEAAPVIDGQPGKSASGPPSFPPPPPPKSKSTTPEPGTVNDPAYAVVSTARKKKKKPPGMPSLPKKPQRSQEEADSGTCIAATESHTVESSEAPPQELVHIDNVLRTNSPSDQRPPHLYSTIQTDEVESSPSVAVPMVSHGYATVSNRPRILKTNGHGSKKRPTGSPRLPPRTIPPPPPPVDSKGKATTPSSHRPLTSVASSPLELESPEVELGTRSHRTLSIGNRRAEQSQPKFLFSQKLCQSLIAVGDSPNVTSSPCVSTSTLLSVDDDSDGDIMYSTEWDSSTDEEEERETSHRPKYYYIAREILTTERTFVKGLTLLDKDFRQAVRSANNAHDKPVIADDVMKLILGNVSSLLSLNSDMLQELEERMITWDEDPRIGDILKVRAPYLKIYTEYISKFDKALRALDESTKKNPLFAEVVHEFEAQPKCASIPIAGYMLDIVQRITRYKLLMTDYVKHLPADSNDRKDSEKALEAISSTATHVNETIRQMDNFRKVVEVRKKLIGDAGDTLITPYRKLLKEGELLKFSRKERQPRMFFLFNDILIYASSIPPANTTYKVIKRIPLEGMQVEPLDDPEMKYGFQIVSTCKSFRLEASNREEKTQWLTAFEIAIKEQAERAKLRGRSRLNLTAQDETDSVPLGHLAPPWLPDNAVSMCQLCSVTFTVTRRRHHCRACGMIFCSDCSSYYAPLKYMNNKSERVCQSCHGKICSSEDGLERSPNKRSGRLSRGHNKMVSMPSVLREVKARDQSAQVSGYLHSHTSKSKRWKKRWYVVYHLVLYEFERHEDVSAKRSITLPSYKVISPVPRHDDPLVFVLKHDGAGKEYFKAENDDKLEKWVDVLTKAVRGEIDQEEPPAPIISSPEEPTSPRSSGSFSSV